MRLPRDLPKDVLAMSAVAFCVSLGFGVVAPAIPLFAKQFGVSATMAGAVVSVFALMRLLSGLAAGRLVDALGERTSLALGVAVVAVSSFVAGLSQNYPELLLLRGVGGVGSAVFGVASMSLVLRVASERMRGRAVSVYRAGFLIGGIAGPAVGGAVLGISLRAPFFLYAGTLGLAGVVAMVFVSRPTPETDSAAAAADAADSATIDEQTPADAPVESSGALPAATSAIEVAADPRDPTVRELLHTPEYQTALVTNLAVGLAVLGLRSAVVPLLFVDKLHAAPGWVGAAFLVSAVVQAIFMYPAGRLTDTAGRRFVIVLGATGSAAGMVVLGLSGSLLVALIGMAVFSVGSAFLGSAPAALVGDVVGRRSGRVVAVFNMAGDAGAVAGPVLAGWLVDQGSFLAAFLFGAVVLLLAGGWGLRLPSPTGQGTGTIRRTRATKG